MGALVTILEMQDRIVDLGRRLADAEKRLEAWRVLRIYHLALSTLHPDHLKPLKDLGEIA